MRAASHTVNRPPFHLTPPTVLRGRQKLLCTHKFRLSDRCEPNQPPDHSVIAEMAGVIKARMGFRYLRFVQRQLTKAGGMVTTWAGTLIHLQRRALSAPGKPVRDRFRIIATAEEHVDESATRPI